MTRFDVFFLLCLPRPAAEEWITLERGSRRAALSGRVLAYKRGTQSFRASGRMFCVTHGQNSRGGWDDRDGRYCNQWPPSDLWTCYGVQCLGKALRFVAGAEAVREGIYVD